VWAGLFSGEMTWSDLLNGDKLREIDEINSGNCTHITSLLVPACTLVYFIGL